MTWLKCCRLDRVRSILYRAVVRPAYFGRPSQPLFGVHDPPRPSPESSEALDRQTSILLCYPGVQEYNMAHWAFRRLSSILSREGFHVLRFDWSGTGDSWGNATDGTVPRWLEDVRIAADELREASGTPEIALVG